jgi:hypothetical protein
MAQRIKNMWIMLSSSWLLIKNNQIQTLLNRQCQVSYKEKALNIWLVTHNLNHKLLSLNLQGKLSRDYYKIALSAWLKNLRKF